MERLVNKINVDFNALNGCPIPAPEEFYVTNGEHASVENLQYVQKALKKLYEYEALEEQGLLKKYDCAIGDTVYRINSRNEIYECTVQGIRQEFNTTSYFLHANINKEDYNIWVDNWFDRCQIGYEFYLTKEEAEKELKRLESAE